MTDLQVMIFSYSEEFEIHSALSSQHVPKYILPCNATYSSLFNVFPP
jgi:hypothetical protein